MRNVFLLIIFISLCTLIAACSTGGDVVCVIDVTEKEEIEGLDQTELDRLAKIKEAEQTESNGHGLNNVIKATPSYNVAEYLALRPSANNPAARDYRVGGNDVLNINVYEEADLSRQGICVSAEGDISFPLINRVSVDGLTTSEIATRISNRLAEGQFLIDAHVSVTVRDYRSKQFIHAERTGR